MTTWDEVVINHDLTLPVEKPSIERVLASKVEYEITKAEVVATPLQSGGQPPLPIRKVIVSGTARIYVKYVADVPDQQVHAAHFEEPFSKLIEWPGGPAPGTPLCVEVVEEHVQIHKVDPRHFSKTIVLQLNLSVNPV
jgi:hypothetical protein